MSNIITGLFNNQRDYKKLETDLENSGFSNSDYIVYLNEDVNANYMASVVIKTDSEAEKAKLVFDQNNVLKVYWFENMTIDDAKSYENLKKEIDVRNKYQIHSFPDLKFKSSSEGMGSEVKS
ncbi:hypothetical protein OZ664_06100 [Elizabethkingia sp. HX WHF]|jgi:hypothetical protein|uniref:Uncharacterized protein n=3 Tax=Elizabethkingia TaxID=308865 RepID=A0ABD5B8V9_ELIMR|nr:MULTISPECIES: hypothetical protein [Elizabethkingia]MDR2231071.1 hypothetical protein [Flavobacteriaceae bacterium]AJW62137.1 hypothetical protein VO54_00650 [Elizabethkingia miricola]AQX10516.1 hypothetical protein BBD34_18585 [Elizabethkingia ursingii]AQX84936.1 hypothetical protein AYC65_07915 [Elizabethkingia bruuniana]ATL42653.1 hypothetical protein CQS02_04685 [Elizabethkingia miricola]